MTTIVLQAAGAAAGGAFGGPVGAMLGRAAGGIAGGFIDRALFGGAATRRTEGPRLAEMPGTGSTEGAPIPRVYGRARIGGELIWATRFEEAVTETLRKQKGGGKGGGSPRTVTRTYSYYGNFAIGLCEGPIAFVRRIWADGKLLDRAGLVVRVHAGGEDQMPDPLITAKEGAEATPAFRGTAYVVFERFPLADYGNRIPQFSFEVVRPVDGVGRMLRAIDLIPGAGEFAYEPAPVSRDFGGGRSASENRHELSAESDWHASLDALQALCPNLRHVALVVSWFGDDLDAGRCTVAPRVDRRDKATIGAEWSVAGLDRGGARETSRVDGRPAYGGTPSDASVIRAIRDLRSRGLGVTLYPFCMMDVPAGNGRPDPWTGAPSQPAFPWRGRITCSPAPGRDGTPDGTAEAAAAVSAFFGSVRPGDFAVRDGRVHCAKPDEWSWRRLVLHCAALARAAGGVDALVIGSELVGLTRVSSRPGVFPAASLLSGIAADAKAMLPDASIVYAADWTEYGGFAPREGELRFPLDPLWASDAVDAVGIDVYWPLSDWRDGPLHADAEAARDGRDLAYLKRGVAGGEGFDWYYENAAARAAQDRRPITDGLGKPWVWRVKDLVGWWSHVHVERVGGMELDAPTAWRPRSKPIWLTEFGCPAVDKGANAPNVFPDPKSAEGGLPSFSAGHRDDLMQLRAVEAVLAHFDPRLGARETDNPVSDVYGGRMVDPDRLYAWAWDARPFPAFPAQSGEWADAANHATGHWLTGRLEGVPTERLIPALLADAEAPEAAAIVHDGFLDGFVVDRPMSVRSALEPLGEVQAFDASSAGGALRFRGRGGGAVLRLSANDLVPHKSGALLDLQRMQESELPREVKLAFADGEADYRRASVLSRRLAGGSRGADHVELAAVTNRSEAQRIADIRLHETWAARDIARFRLRPGLIGIEPGDVLELPVDGGFRPFRVVRITDRGERAVEAVSTDPSVHVAPPAAQELRTEAAPALPGPALAVVVDLPVGRGTPTVLQALAVHADPWPGGFVLRRSSDGASFAAAASVEVPALIGRTVEAFGPGPLRRWDAGNALVVRFEGEEPAGEGDAAALAGENALGVLGPDGRWEVLSFARSETVGPRTKRFTRLLRGLGGSEDCAARVLDAGARVVALDGALVPLAAGLDAVGSTVRWRLSPFGRDHGDPSTVAFTATAGDAALRPLAPVRLTGRRTPEGVLFGWIRRARTGGDGWELAEIPLDESEERYLVELLAGSRMVRRAEVGTTAWLYPAADEIADHGGPSAVHRLRVAQASPSIGPGAFAEATVILR
jgi:hypothetical protein